MNDQAQFDRKYLRESPLKVALWARILAKALDLLIFVALSLVFYPLGAILGLIYLSVGDWLQDGQSAGKKVMGLGVISLIDGGPCTLKRSIVRNLPLTIPLFFLIIPFWGWILTALLLPILVGLELYLLFKLDSGHRLGDVMADTSVVVPTSDGATVGRARSGWFKQEETPLH